MAPAVRERVVRKLIGQRTDRPLERTEFRYQQRLNEDGTIPPNALMNAKRQRDHMIAAKAMGGIAAAGVLSTSWTWLGPGNIGGRVRALLIHPTSPEIMWAGTASGGIWKTTDDGESWFPLDDFLPSLAVCSMAMDPDDPDVLYAGTGEGFGNIDDLPGAGIFKSTDAGDSWQQLANTIPIASDPTTDP